MKPFFKQWKATVVLASFFALAWTGCQANYKGTSSSATYQTGQSGVTTRTVRGTDTVDVAAPVHTPPVLTVPIVPQVATVTTSGPNGAEIRTDLVHLLRRAPGTAAVGQTFDNDMTVTALADVANVTVNLFLPPDATLVRAEPPATVVGRKLTWVFDAMQKGETQTIKVLLRSDVEGAFTSCATISALPKACLVTQIGKPTLFIEKTGPATAKLGDKVTYNVVIRNTGSSIAENVTVTDAVPEGMSHESGSRLLSFNVGNLAPGEGKQASVTLKADQRGRFCNVVNAKSSNAGAVSSTACTVVMQQMLSVVKTGPAEAFIGKPADYQIVVHNPGDSALTGVVVTDTAPPETTLVSAGSGTITGNQAVWRLGELKAGERQTFNVSIRSIRAGNFCNNVSVATTEGLTGSSQACTVWKGFPAMLLEMVDDPDPLQIGETTTYTIRITNQGSANDNNVGMTVNFPPQLMPVEVAGATPGTITGKTVRFAPHPVLGAKQVIVWTVKAKALAVGDARVKAELTSELLRIPVVKEEATQVY